MLRFSKLAGRSRSCRISLTRKSKASAVSVERVDKKQIIQPIWKQIEKWETDNIRGREIFAHAELCSVRSKATQSLCVVVRPCLVLLEIGEITMADFRYFYLFESALGIGFVAVSDC